MSKHIVETTEKVDHISQEEKMVSLKKECNALIDNETIKHLTGEIKLTSSKDDLIKYLESKAWELKEENIQLKKVVREYKKFPFKVREALSSGANVFDVTYHMENEIYKVTKEIKDKVEKIKEKLQQLSQELEELGDEEQEKFDNLNEGMQAMYKFQKLEENANCFYTAQECVEETINALEELDQ